MFVQERAVGVPLRLVLRPFVRRKPDADLDGFIAGQVFPAQRADLLAVNGLADRGLKLAFRAVLPLERGRQPQPVRRQRQVGRHQVGRTRQVVALVEDHQPEPVAEPFHVQVRGIVGGHGDRLDVVVASADQSHLDVELAGDHAVPLLHQVDSGDDHQGAALDARHGHQGDEGFSRAGGQHDHAPSAGLPPGVYRFLLIGEGRPVRLKGQVPACHRTVRRPGTERPGRTAA